MSALHRKLRRDLLHMRGQAITIALVVSSGVAVLVMALSSYDSLRGAQQRFYTGWRFADAFAEFKQAPATIMNDAARLPGVAQADARLVWNVLLDVPGVRQPVMGRFITLPRNGNTRLNQVHVRSGRLPDPSRPNEVLVSEAFAIKNGYRLGDSITAVINGRKSEFRLVGFALSPEYIHAINVQAPLADDRRYGIFWVAYGTLAAALDMQGSVNSLAIRFAPGAQPQSVLHALDGLLDRHGGLGAYLRKDQPSHQVVTSEISQQKSMAQSIPVIFMAVAAFLLYTVMNRLVGTQREQIATLKAVGYSNTDLSLHYLQMVGIVVLAGALLGIALGAWMGRGMTVLYGEFFRFPSYIYQLRPAYPILAGGVSLVTGWLAAMFAVRWVARLAPAQAMRPPSPPMFRKSLLERSGLTRVISPEGRMVWRNMSRRPVRTMLTTLGLALSVAVIMLGLFWGDSVNYIVNQQFFQVQRWDAQVLFVQPVGENALTELRAKPGVRAAEGARSVAVRVHAGARSRLTLLTGLSPGSRLTVITDRNDMPLPVPQSGIIISSLLAAQLHAKPGDGIRIEALEGKRPVIDTVIAGVSGDKVGTNAYAPLTQLHAWMKEGHLISSANLTIDAAHVNELYRHLKNEPKVLSVTDKSEMVRSFWDTTGRNIMIFVSFFIAFAIVIAVGVVYNSVRIALAERAWELATLRVLGFTNGEVSRLLLREMAVETVLGIPLGFWCGYWMCVLAIALFSSDTFQIPMVIERPTYTLSGLIVLGAAILSAAVVRRKVNQIDLVGVLKARE